MKINQEIAGSEARELCMSTAGLKYTTPPENFAKAGVAACCSREWWRDQWEFQDP